MTSHPTLADFPSFRIFANTALCRAENRIKEAIWSKAGYKLAQKGFAVTRNQIEEVKAAKSKAKRRLPNWHDWQEACDEAAKEIVWSRVFGTGRRV